MTGVGRIVKAAIGVVVLIVLAVTINGWYGEYKHASSAKTVASSTASDSVDSTQVVAVVGGKKVTVLVDGLVLRVTPAATAAPVRALKKGESLILVGTSGAWLQLRDAANGKMGYVSNSPASLRVEK